MKTVGLAIITKELTDELLSTLNQVAEHVDGIYIQVNGGEFEPAKSTGKFHFSAYEWNNNFADARNALHKEIKTDYWAWLDTDDDVQGLDQVRDLVQYMDREGIDIMHAPYHYMVTEQGTTELQNRERIIRSSLRGSWKGAIHETFIPQDPAIQETTNKIQWVHRKTKAEHEDSQRRNRSILEAEYARGHAQRNPDPRIAYYLGLNLAQGTDKEGYAAAIPYFEELIATGGWDEERYRAYLQIFSCCFELGRFDEAIQAALSATTELPDWPDAYYMLQQVYYELEDFDKSLEWFKVGSTKTRPATDSAFNPVVTGPQPIYLAATALLFVGEVKQAFQVLMKLQKEHPNYTIPQAVKEETLNALNEANTIDSVRNLIGLLGAVGGDPVKVLNSLPATLRSDPRLTKERRELFPGKKWPKDSIVFYCGAGYETWGPDTLNKGMGGSEEAVVYLARELNALVGDADQDMIVIYNERQEEYSDHVWPDGMMHPECVTYLPWTDINPNDEFDTFVCWRDPSIAKHIKARKVLCDLHDIIPVEAVYSAIPYVDTFLFKTKYHRDLYPEVPEDKCAIIGNGIVRKQFK